MAITQTRIDGSAEQLGTAVFTATADTAVTTIHLCNISSAADATVNVYLLPSDGSTTAPTVNNKLYNHSKIYCLHQISCSIGSFQLDLMRILKDSKK